ncbi:glycosyltransferase family A protein [Nocardiopsis lambiniae]|uniref:Glycosyltransferase family A protein n=1 Tax=Nocardiopsis lambiniae TaxID=3075539 RepID=A0ABU2M4I5_9ACTN|nr:glycosyltransferase family A protein [Nocardiopsis sp. DSM 44743]MDT0327504.1 glycosyltransferase family A protein [Nocardiopsis sp. DSM 44743]
MITSAVRQALRTRGDEPAVLCLIGDLGPDRAELAALRLRGNDRRVDLDAHGMGRPVTVEGIGGEGEPSSVGLVVIAADGLTDLRRAVTVTTQLPPTAHLLVVVRHVPAHLGPLVPAPPTIDEWNDLHELRVRRFGNRGWACELCFPGGMSVAEALAAVVHGPRGRRRGPGVGVLGGLSGTQAALWRPGDVAARGVTATGPVEIDRVTPVSDLVLRLDDGGGLPFWEDVEVPAVDRLATDATVAPEVRSPEARLRVYGTDPVSRVAPVDERFVNPIGFTKKTKGPLGELVEVEGRVVVRDETCVRIRPTPDGTVTENDLERVRHLRGVRVGWPEHGDTATVRIVAALAAGGVPLIGDPAPMWAAGLGAPLAELIAGGAEDVLLDPLRREEHSIRLRRAALRTHGVRTRWRSLAAEAGLPVPPETRVSVVLCTRRPELVGFALAQIARQRHVRFEAVLALHGFSADLPEVDAAVAEFRATGIPLVVHEAEGEKVFGAVMNDAVDRASGTVIAKWDDDDWYGPEHLADLMLARAYSGADVVGISQNFTYLEELDLTVWRGYRSEVPSPAIVGSTILADRVVIEDVGGFRPRPRAIDSQFLLAVTRAGCRVYRTHGFGYLLRRAGGGHTWNVDLGYFLRNHTEQWIGWRPSVLLEGVPAPFGAQADRHIDHPGEHVERL